MGLIFMLAADASLRGSARPRILIKMWRGVAKLILGGMEWNFFHDEVKCGIATNTAEDGDSALSIVASVA